jgi:hypothetical protein
VDDIQLKTLDRQFDRLPFENADGCSTLSGRSGLARPTSVQPAKAVVRLDHLGEASDHIRPQTTTKVVYLSLNVCFKVPSISGITISALMSSGSFTAIRLLLLPVLTWAGFVGYGYSLLFFGQIIPIPEERSLVFGVLLAQGFLSAAVISVVFCYPVALLYKNSAVTVALVMTLPVLILRLPEFTTFDRHPLAIAISAYEVLAYGLFLVVGVWLAHRQLTRSSFAFKLAYRKRERPII